MSLTSLLPFDLDTQQTRDALRLGLQSAAAAVLCLILLGMIGSEERFVGVLSAVLIVQPSIGRTISAGWERLLATIIGSAVGLLCLFLLPPGYGVIVVLAILMFVMNFIAGFRPNWRYGVVAVVALALADSGNMDVVEARVLSIGIGIAAGIAVSFLVWPESAAKRGARYRRTALNAAAHRFAAALRDEEDGEDAQEAADKARRRFHDALSNGREVIGSSKTGDTSRLQTTFEHLEELYTSIILIGRVDSPLSLFSEAVIERCDLIDAGQDAICALTTDDETGNDAFATFADAVDQVEDGLSEHQLDNSGRHAASVVFALREMERCMEAFRNRNAEDGSTPLSQQLSDTVKSAISN